MANTFFHKKSFVALAVALTVMSAVGGSSDAGDYNMPDAVKGTMDPDAVIKLMETPAGEAFTAWKRANPAPYWLFGEDRSRAVRNNIVPAHWFNGSECKCAGRFAGKARPGEFYVFQTCVASETARELVWAVIPNGGVKTQTITPWRCRVEANGVKPLWACVFVPEDAAGKTLTGIVSVIDQKNRIDQILSWSLRVEGEVLKDGGVGDAFRLARLTWLDSDVGSSHTEPTRPFSAIQVDTKERRLKILGRELALGEDGLPSSYRSWFNGSATKIGASPRDIFAAPVTFALPGEATGFDFKFTRITPCRVEWRSSGVVGQCKYFVTVDGALEFDGFATFGITVNNFGAEEVALSPALVLRMPTEVARYQMGLNRRGGEWPAEGYEWSWRDGVHQDAAWFGEIYGGVMLRLRDQVRQRPLINAYHKWKPLVLPEAWKRGKVKFTRPEASGIVAVRVEGGDVTLRPNETKYWGFDLFLTPFKPADLRKHLADRYIHLGQRNQTADCRRFVSDGATVMNLHHNTVWNPYINYPYNDDGGPHLKKIVETAHAEGLRAKIYYTTRELTQNLPEFFALKSLDGEVLFRRPPEIPGWPITNRGGPHPWLAEHVGTDILPAWRERVNFPKAYPPRLDLAVITNPDSKRWNNFYLSGLDYLVRNFGIDGLYIDDTALDREAMQRVRRILDADGNTGRRVDMHSWSHFNEMAGFVPSDICYMELYPYADLLWHGEGFPVKTGSPEFWLIERSGLAWGLLGQELGKGNPWKGLVFAQTDRWGWGGDPRPLWKFFDEVSLGEAEMLGFWDSTLPRSVELLDAPDCRATAYAIPADAKRPARAVVAVANFGTAAAEARMKFDLSVLGIDAKRANFRLAEIKGLQNGAPFDPKVPLPIPVEGGAVIVISAD